MATTRASLGSLVQVVTSSATTIVDVLTVVNDGVSMAAATVKSLKQKQAINLILEAAASKQTIHERKAIELAENSLEAVKFCDKSVGHKTAYDMSYELLSKALSDAGIE